MRAKRNSLYEQLLDDKYILHLRDYFWEQLQEQFGSDVVLNGHPVNRLPNTLNVSFVNRQGGEILADIPQSAASTGAACHSGAVKLSPVLEAMSIRKSIGMGAVRFSLGRYTTKEEIETVVQLLLNRGWYSTEHS